ncbi:MAG: guanylate kinase, partial [Clostridia bacterium]|nr:guanylate kinase [Clostridia bacterium]
YTRTFTYHYGTLKSEVEKSINAGVDVLLELNVVGAANIKKLYTDDCVTIFLTPPSLEALKARLIGRGSETEETLKRRLAEIENESKESVNYDYTVVNDVAKNCAEKVLDIISAERIKRKETLNIFD